MVLLYFCLPSFSSLRSPPLPSLRLICCCLFTSPPPLLFFFGSVHLLLFCLTHSVSRTFLSSSSPLLPLLLILFLLSDVSCVFFSTSSFSVVPVFFLLSPHYSGLMNMLCLFLDAPSLPPYSRPFLIFFPPHFCPSFTSFFPPSERKIKVFGSPRG